MGTGNLERKTNLRLLHNLNSMQNKRNEEFASQFYFKSEAITFIPMFSFSALWTEERSMYRRKSIFSMNLLRKTPTEGIIPIGLGPS